MHRLVVAAWSFRRLALLSLALISPDASCGQTPSCLPGQDGANPCPVPLRRPARRPLSAMARIGEAIFHDKGLSGSGALSCASCHDPANHYGPSRGVFVFHGGLNLDRPGRRTIPTLTYTERRPNFSIGPDNPVAETAPALTNAPASDRGTKTAANTASSATSMVPQGGLFWDGRADTLQQQAEGPLFDPAEMASTPQHALDYLSHTPYAKDLRLLAGIPERQTPALMLAEALFALSRYQIEAPDFHLYNSKFDRWLEGKAAFTPEERRGYLAFNDPTRGNCAACHLDTPTADHLPPLFTDHQYEALNAPRNRALGQGRAARYSDLGVCDRVPGGRKTLSAYCGMFATPTLRNSATRPVFFHNGVFHSLKEVLDFYALRDIAPARFYGRSRRGKAYASNDIPPPYVGNIDRKDIPFGGKEGGHPSLNEEDRQAIVAFLQTLTDSQPDEELPAKPQP